MKNTDIIVRRIINEALSGKQEFELDLGQIDKKSVWKVIHQVNETLEETSAERVTWRGDTMCGIHLFEMEQKKERRY